MKTTRKMTGGGGVFSLLLALAFALAANLFFSCSNDAGGSEGSGGSSGGNAPVASLPASVGENPLLQGSSSQGSQKEKIELFDEHAYEKIEFNLKNKTAILLSEEKDDDGGKIWEKECDLRYAWDAEKGEIYLAVSAVYFNRKAYSNFNSYFEDYWADELKWAKEEYEEWKEENPSENTLSFEKWFESEDGWGVSVEDAKKEERKLMEPYFSKKFSEMDVYSCKTENGKLTLTEKFAKNFFGMQGYFSGGYLEGSEWEAYNEALHYSKGEGENYVSYRWDISSHDDKSITYALEEDEDTQGKNLPKNITASYTYDEATQKLALSFADPMNNNAKVERELAFVPAVWKEE